MSKKSHTPGPWVSRNNMVFCGKKCICSNVIAEDVAMSIANARLMAAAPELLEALIAMEREKSDYMTRNNLGDPALERTNKLARAAIAKATA
ncbi:TPA: hypothetical protein P6M69_000560 [Pseudomonas aeruginosa]|uniref:hypothetical protein n=1 Tax=Pseudomonas TaxID=286 RepID=UPI0003B9DE60|nr:hypothetical protein [Pseudomonas aeruginosa]ERW09411.1 hypothetical protein Q037_00961 [Pseudomonas aeruginosa BWHPSA024]EZN51282.1 hypothetical protein AJ76_00594 [Pseudomonas aeruginosa BWH036]MBH3785063.1 hypothetical protein [Pseudomonas aeruginosa]MCQ9744169.1 hypothetical protein [Pseudomonas aeruginosa]MDU3632678.1 hypothetical protein [Pseudomonas aeruginosa]